MGVLSGLKPEKVFYYFEELCKIPHGSYHTKQISDYLVQFAKERNLECSQDDSNNVVIRKAASAGYEDAPVVILQGHCDMVCEKTADSTHDFEKDGLDLMIGFVLNYAAYFAEIYRSGIESMPVGQYEAAEILGYSKSQTFLHIILPQVIKRILPSVTNEVITLVKDTSLAFVIAVSEMFTIAKALASSQTSMVPYVAAGIFYYVFNFLVAWIMEKIEKHLSYYR